MVFDTIDEALKGEKLDANQKENIKTTLGSSKYSKINYTCKSADKEFLNELNRNNLSNFNTANTFVRPPLNNNLTLAREKSNPIKTQNDNDDAIKINVDHMHVDASEIDAILASPSAKDSEKVVADAIFVNKMSILSAENYLKAAYITNHKDEILKKKLLDGSYTESQDFGLFAEPKSRQSVEAYKIRQEQLQNAQKNNAINNDSIKRLQVSLKEMQFHYEAKSKKRATIELKERAAAEAARREMEIRLAKEKKEREEREIEQARIELENKKKQQEQEEAERVKRAAALAAENERRIREAAEREKREKLEAEAKAAAEAERARKEKDLEMKKRAENELICKKAIDQIDQAEQTAIKALNTLKARPNDSTTSANTKQLAQLLLSQLKEYVKLKQGISANSSQTTSCVPADLSANLSSTNELSQKLLDSIASDSTTAESKTVSVASSFAKKFDENNRNGANELTLKSYYTRYAEQMEKLRIDCEKSFSNDPGQKMYKFDLQKAINFPVNSLLDDKSSHENNRNFNEKIKTITRLLSGQTCAITSTLTVNAMQHPKSINFCLIYLAKKMIEKAEETVSSRPETSFQYAHLILEVTKGIGEFETILFAQFQEKCPYVVPYYKPRQPSQTDQQYMETLGYKLVNGKLEDEILYQKRMNGILHLYFTLLGNQSKHPNASKESILFNGNGLKRAWQWFADVLNMTPRPNITAEMLVIFFKCCGYQMQQAYGNQFMKLVQATFNDFLLLIKQIPVEKQAQACVGRLEAVFDNLKKTNKFVEWKKA